MPSSARAGIRQISSASDFTGDLIEPEFFGYALVWNGTDFTLGDFEAAGAAALAISNHEIAANPHSQYALSSSLGTMASAIEANYLLASGSRAGAVAGLQAFNHGVSVGASKAATFLTPGVPFTLHSAQVDFNGTRDDVYYWAYNLLPGDTTQRVDTSKAQMKFAIEADYNNGTAHLIEYNFDYMSADGLTNKRPISWAADLDSQDSGLIFAAGKISLLSESNVREWVILTAPTTATNKFVVRAGASQSGNFFEWQDSATNVLSAINAGGGFITSAISSPSGILTFDDTNVRYQRAASATNEKNWAVEVGSNSIAWKAYNDAYSAAGTAIEITRSGPAITKLAFPVAEMFVSGSNPNIVSGASAALGIGGSSFQLRSASPAVVLENTSAAADNKIWTLGETGSNTLTFRVLNDALGAAANWLVVTRSGASISEVNFPSGQTKIATLGITQTPVSETIIPTHTFFILLNGVYYKIPCVPA